MLVRDISLSLLWDLHIALEFELGPEIVVCLEARLEPELVVGLVVGGNRTSYARPGSNGMTLLLTGIDPNGVIRSWREWVIPASNQLASIAALCLRAEDSLRHAREFEAWADKAVEALRAKQPVPPRLVGRRYS